MTPSKELVTMVAKIVTAGWTTRWRYELGRRRHEDADEFLTDVGNLMNWVGMNIG